MLILPLSPGGALDSPLAPGHPLRNAPESVTTMSITLCVCTYNRGPEIVRTLESIEHAATDRLDEVVVVDNNSTDDTGEVVDRFASETRSVRVRRVVETAQGLTHARSRGLDETGSPLLAFIDDDVVLDKGWTGALVRRFEASGSVGAVGGVIELDWLTGPTRLAASRTDLLAAQDFGPEPVRLEQARGALAGAALGLRVAAVREAGWPGNAVLADRVGNASSSGGDYEIVARVRQAGYEVWYEPGARCRHRIDGTRQTRPYLLKLAEGIAGSSAWFDWVCEGEPEGDEGVRWARSRIADTRRRLIRTLALEFRPARRAFRVRERRAAIRAYESLIESLGSAGAGPGLR